MLTIHGRVNSHNVKKVLWLADELGLTYERHDVGLQHGMSDAYLALNPHALIPTIEDKGLVLWESNAILRYLAARYGNWRWWPGDPAARAVGDKWMDWQQGYAVAQNAMFMNLVRRAPAERDEEAMARSIAACGEKMQILDRYLAHNRWLSGDEIGLGDVAMGTYANTWFTLDVERPDVPHAADWYARLRDRPAFARHVMIPLT